MHVAAFGREVEAALADRLRPMADPLVSLVADLDVRVVGHIIATPVTVDGFDAPVPPMAFGPLGVVPELQRGGIGGALKRAGIVACRELSVPFTHGGRMAGLSGEIYYLPPFNEV